MKRTRMNQTAPILDPDLEADDICHGFFTRTGGVSEGIYKGLNVGLGSDDNREHVIENRSRVANTLGTRESHLLTVHQIHSPDVVEVTAPWQGADRPKADGMVTRVAGLAIGALAADCGPVLFADKENRIVGACHAGWKGATGGVLENTIAAMEKLGAERSSIKATLGPTISGEAYEVGPEFVDRLIALSPENEAWLKSSKNEGHAMFDLPGYIVARLGKAGVQAKWTGQCTYQDEVFFSYRRTTHRGEPDYGRQISAIMIKAEA